MAPCPAPCPCLGDLRSKGTPNCSCREPLWNKSNDSYKAQLSLAKKIARNFKQDNATLFDYGKYLLRLLWIRENWLRPEIISHQQYGCQCIDIVEKEIIPLLWEALWFFCGYEINFDAQKEIIELLSTQGHIEIKPTDCSSCFFLVKCRLTYSGKSVAESSDPRLLQILANESKFKKDPANDNAVHIPIGRYNWVMNEVKTKKITQKKAVGFWNALPPEEKEKYDNEKYNDDYTYGAFRQEKSRLKKFEKNCENCENCENCDTDATM